MSINSIQDWLSEFFAIHDSLLFSSIARTITCKKVCVVFFGDRYLLTYLLAFECIGEDNLFKSYLYIKYAFDVPE